MNIHTGELVNEARVRVAGLMFECPLGKCVPGCPLSSMRKLPKHERSEVLEQLTTDECMQICRKHNKCLIERERNMLY